MKGVEYLDLEGNFTKELPPSFGNLTGLKRLHVQSESGEAHLPGSIYNLQHIEALRFIGNFIFPKNVEIDGQPVCNSLRCSSKYVFPMLKRLQLSCIEIHEIEFILNYCCPFTLEELSIYKSKVVTLPESMSRSERLHMLIIKGCIELREIPRLPHSIRHVEVRDCNSLDLQSFFQKIERTFLQLISLVKMDFSLYLHYDILRSDAEKDDCKSSKRHSYCVSGEENDQSFANNELDERLMFSFGKLISRNIRICA
ncbi:hypothetical protein CMV_019952 [Castanea mollissima]|uniref:Disease resistance protein RPS4B/Roq1-like leucine-rich repeats domain-containing protein n=1 Tax=Castanea mollissima TaxID=60419 RepID=A0A8J4QIS5_9ROSI|nr:hypothetical protein CMV_019952 [Castanea mollissima]